MTLRYIFSVHPINISGNLICNSCKVQPRRASYSVLLFQSFYCLTRNKIDCLVCTGCKQYFEDQHLLLEHLMRITCIIYQEHEVLAVDWGVSCLQLSLLFTKNKFCHNTDAYERVWIKLLLGLWKSIAVYTRIYFLFKMLQIHWKSIRSYDVYVLVVSTKYCEN